MATKVSPLQNKLVPVLVVLLIVASFLIGSLYTQVSMLKGGTGIGGANKGGVANNPPTNPTAAAPVGNTSNPVDVDITGAPVLGSKDAKVALVEFTDYQCPFCGQLFTNTFPQIKKDYIDTGKIKYIVRDFPLTQIHPYAQKSAEAANCALEQNKFWEYHDTLFKNQTALLPDNLKQYAGTLGLNANQFNSCLESAKMADKISKSLSDGAKYGVNGTPASFVGVSSGNTVKGVLISGAQPFDAFKTAIETALKQG